FAQAERHARDAVARLGDRARNSAVRCAAARSLGTVLRVLSRYDEAERHLRAAVRWARRLGPHELAASQNALGMLFKYTGRYAEAVRLYSGALHALEALFGCHDVRLTPILHNLGGVEHARGQFAHGEAYARRGLAIRRRWLGHDHVQVAADEVALGALLEGQGRLGDAARLYRRALRVFEHSYGRGHYEVAVTCNNLGTIAYARGRNAEALAFYRRSLRIKARMFGDGHPDVAVTRDNLAIVNRSLGRHARGARPVYPRALRVRARVRPGAPPRAAVSGQPGAAV
ncbi:MAG: tetratricopeptide repeat protein, partial [Myxococcales bacterium]|nr:tetratricopeptide repeat protein [Myxococcales bacterium]